MWNKNDVWGMALVHYMVFDFMSIDKKIGEVKKQNTFFFTFSSN